MNNFNNIHQMTQEIYTSMAKQRESILLDQLSDFVSRGLIEIEETQPILVQSQDSSKFECKMAVRLVLKDKEYIIKLETEIEELKAYKAKVQEILK